MLIPYHSIKALLIDLYLNYSKHYNYSFKYESKLMNELSIRHQRPKFQSYVLN